MHLDTDVTSLLWHSISYIIHIWLCIALYYRDCIIIVWQFVSIYSTISSTVSSPEVGQSSILWLPPWQGWNPKGLTVYPKKYAHGLCFAVLCCGYTLTDFPISIRLTSLALWQSNDCPSASKATLMNMDKYFMWIHYERLHNHNKAKHNKTVCIFLGIYCMWWNKVIIVLRGSVDKWQKQNMTATPIHVTKRFNSHPT